MSVLSTNSYRKKRSNNIICHKKKVKHLHLMLMHVRLSYTCWERSTKPGWWDSYFLLKHKGILSSLLPLLRQWMLVKRNHLCACLSLNVSERERYLDRKPKVKICESHTSMRGDEMERESYFSLHSHATVGFLDHADIVSSIP